MKGAISCGRRTATRAVLTQIKKFPQVWSQWRGYHNFGDAKVHKVNNQDRNGREGWYEYFVSPSNIEEIVSQSKYDHRLE